MKKGFTLIELLAVLALLITITAIAVIDYNKRVNQADSKAALVNARSYISEVNRLFLKQDLKDEEPLEAGIYQVSSTDTNEKSLNDMLSVSGTLPKEGTVTINEDYQVEQATLEYKLYTVTYENGEYDVSKRQKNG